MLKVTLKHRLCSFVQGLSDQIKHDGWHRSVVGEIAVRPLYPSVIARYTQGSNGVIILMIINYWNWWERHAVSRWVVLAWEPVTRQLSMYGCRQCLCFHYKDIMIVCYWRAYYRRQGPSRIEYYIKTNSIHIVAYALV